MADSRMGIKGCEEALGTYLLLDADATNSHSSPWDAFVDFLKEICVHNINLTRKNELSVFHLMTVSMLFCSRIHCSLGVNQQVLSIMYWRRLFSFEITHCLFLQQFFFFFKHLFWSIIALQWCVSFCFITK